MTRGTTVLLVAAFAMAAGCATAHRASLPAGTTAHGQEKLAERLGDCQPAECLRIAREIAFKERPEDTEFLEAAMERALRDKGTLKTWLFRNFPDLPPAGKAEALRFLDRNFDLLITGMDFQAAEIARMGLFDDDPRVRAAAGLLVTRHRFNRFANTLIDAAEMHPELTVPALVGIGIDRDPRAARWVVRHLSSPDEHVRMAARWALRAIGPPAGVALREALERAKGPEEWGPLLDGWLLVLSGNDSSVLSAWLEEHGPEDPERAERIRRALAALEVSRYRPEPVPKPDWTPAEQFVEPTPAR